MQRVILGKGGSKFILFLQIITSRFTEALSSFFLLEIHSVLHMRCVEVESQMDSEFYPRLWGPGKYNLFRLV